MFESYKKIILRVPPQSHKLIIEPYSLSLVSGIPALNVNFENKATLFPNWVAETV